MGKILFRLFSAILITAAACSSAHAQVSNYLTIQACIKDSSGKLSVRHVSQNFVHGQGEVKTLVELESNDLYEVTIRSIKFTNGLDRFEFSASVKRRSSGMTKILDLTYPNPEIMQDALMINSFHGGETVCAKTLQLEGAQETFTLGAVINLIHKN